MNSTVTKTQNVATTLEILNLFAIEINLESILIKELEQGFASDISSAF